MTYLLLFWEFFKIGLFTFGGGVSGLPFLFELSTKYDWYSVQELANMVAVAECTPGPISINMATYVGYATAGIGGSLIATLAIILPPLSVSLLVCLLLHRYAAKKWLDRAFWGLRPAVAGLVALVCYNLIELALAKDLALGFASGVSWLNVAVFVVLTTAMFLFKKHPVLYIAAGAVLGIVLKL